MRVYEVKSFSRFEGKRERVYSTFSLLLGFLILPWQTNQLENVMIHIANTAFVKGKSLNGSRHHIWNLNEEISGHFWSINSVWSAVCSHLWQRITVFYNLYYIRLYGLNIVDLSEFSLFFLALVKMNNHLCKIAIAISSSTDYSFYCLR